MLVLRYYSGVAILALCWYYVVTQHGVRFKGLTPGGIAASGAVPYRFVHAIRDPPHRLFVVDLSFDA